MVTQKTVRMAKLQPASNYEWYILWYVQGKSRAFRVMSRGGVLAALKDSCNLQNTAYAITGGTVGKDIPGEIVITDLVWRFLP